MERRFLIFYFWMNRTSNAMRRTSSGAQGNVHELWKRKARREEETVRTFCFLLEGEDTVCF